MSNRLVLLHIWLEGWKHRVSRKVCVSGLEFALRDTQGLGVFDILRSTWSEDRLLLSMAQDESIQSNKGIECSI